MVKRKPALLPATLPSGPEALTVATGFARQGLISLSAAEHPHPHRARQEFEKLCEADALFQGALDIIRAHKERLAVKL